MSKGAEEKEETNHEERVGALYEPLELVGPGLGLGGRVEEVNGESLQGEQHDESM
jgi:hypothetical protein